MTYTGVGGVSLCTTVTLDLAVFEPQLYRSQKTFTHVVTALEKIAQSIQKR